VPTNRALLKVHFSVGNYFVGISYLNLVKCDFGGGRFNMGYANLTFKVILHLVTVQQLNIFLKFYTKTPVA
jgi:hypothetical protein